MTNEEIDRIADSVRQGEHFHRAFARAVLAAAVSQKEPLHPAMHDANFIKVWGDAGGGDVGRRALANYAFELGRQSAAPVAPAEPPPNQSCFDALCTPPPAAQAGAYAYLDAR